MILKKQKLFNYIIFLLFLLSIKANGQLYFQQEVSYKISVTLNDRKNTLNGFETITYTNNSPDDLTAIYFHLYPNAYKNRNTALCKQLVADGNTSLFFADDKQRGYIDSLDFKCNGQPVQWNLDTTYMDICKLQLPKPLLSGESIEITTPFFVKIPSASFSRLGYMGDAFMITQWYPKPAVYDAQGWHAMPYLNQGEFYSEFATYDVSITLPSNYVVGATGDLQNQDELNWLDKKAAATAAITSFSDDMSFPASDTTYKTLNYKQVNVHDFAWFTDKRYHVLKGELILPVSKRKVALWSMFTNADAELWKKSIEYIHDGANFYSTEIGEYPYNQITAVDGTISAGGGMEYPTVTVIGSSYTDKDLETTIVHEVGHNWFYGILGTNERDNGWMDEGINSYYEMRYMLTKYPPEKFGNINGLQAIGSAFSKLFEIDKLNYKQTFMQEYLMSGRTWNDQPINLPSTSFSPSNYGTIMYNKTALAMDYLRHYLGNQLFNECMQQYFQGWKFMHPGPDDLKGVFEDVSKQSIDWFFDDHLPTIKKANYKICKTELNIDSTYTVTVKNKGKLTGPLFLSGMNGDTLINEICINGFKNTAKLNFPPGNYSQFIAGNNYDIPDINIHNNYYRTKGVLKNQQSVKLNFLTGLEQQSYRQIYYSPVVGWNNYDKWMLGIVLHNTALVPKNLEFAVMPLYSFQAKAIAGKASIYYNLVSNEKFQTNFSISAEHYNIGETTFTVTDPQQTLPYAYSKIEPDIVFQWRKNPRASVLQSIAIKNYFIFLDNDFIIDGNNIQQNSYNEYYNELIYSYADSRTLDPYRLKGSIQTGKQFMKVAAEAEYNISYKKRKKGITFRLFAGSFIYNESAANVNFRMTGFSGIQDYLFNDIYLGRTQTEGALSQQFTEADGAFKINTGVGQTNKWLTSFNTKITIPALPILFFLDLGTYQNAKNAYDGSKALMFDGGIGIWLIRNIAEVYFPLFYSSDIKGNLEANNIDTFGERIRFQLNFNLANPLKLQRQIFK